MKKLNLNELALELEIISWEETRTIVGGGYEDTAFGVYGENVTIYGNPTFDNSDLFNVYGGGGDYSEGGVTGGWGNYGGYGSPQCPIQLPNVTINGSTGWGIATRINEALSYALEGNQAIFYLAQKLAQVPANEIIDGVTGNKILLYLGNAVGVVGVADELRQYYSTGDPMDLLQAAYGAAGIAFEFTPGGAIVYIIGNELLTYIDQHK